MRDLQYVAVLALAFSVTGVLGGCADLGPTTDKTAELTTASISAPPPAKTPQGTRVTSDATARVFVLAGLAADCSPISIPMITVGQAPTKGTITFLAVPETTVQFSVSGKCIGKQVPGVGVFYKANEGASGSDVFTVVARSGNRELASRTITVEIAE
jgi:hypothetical protein